MATEEINLDAYNEGRRAFAEGGSLLSVFMKVVAAVDSDNEPAELAALSHGIGFFDAALDKLRGITL